MTGDLLESLRCVAGPVSRETLERLLEFEKEFARWSQRINLAAPSASSHLWERHILDSAQLFSLKPASLKWLDLGSGGGFPGAVLALMLIEREGAQIDLVESAGKKAAFLQSVLKGLGAPAAVHRIRIEEAKARVGVPEVVTARALAPLKRLLHLSRPWLEAGAVGLFHKGRDYAGELEESRSEWSFDLVEHESRTDASGRILEIGNLRPRRKAASECDAIAGE